MVKNTVVVGAGVSGLTTALQLAKTSDFDVTVLARHMPGDYDIEYASPWAGANFLPFSEPATPAREYERMSWPMLERLARELPEAGIHLQTTITHRRNKDEGSPTGKWMTDLMREDAWFKNLVPDFKVLGTLELPAGIDGGTSFTSVCINTAIYLPWLVSQCLREGVTFRRANITHISDALSLHRLSGVADIVVNCTGLGSIKFGGVTDTTLYPARGQIVLVRNGASNKMSVVSGTDDGPDEAIYIMERAAGGGTILGGCLQADVWDGQPDPGLAVRIMQRCIQTNPGLVPKGRGIEALDVVRHGVGLRPMRRGGIRVEKEVLFSSNGSPFWVIHNYGHGGYGYQTSYGCALRVEKLGREIGKLESRL